MRIPLLFSIVLVLLLACERTSVRGVNIIGEWYKIDVDCDSCMIFNFQNEGDLSIYIVESGANISLNYKLFYNKIEIEYLDEIDTYDVIKYSRDEIEIVGFTTSNIPEEMDTRLVRAN
jgi:hypothetical protein